MTADTPKVSIGMPVYNSQKYLESAINSVLSQTYTDFELIISDNASTDRTYQICHTYMAKDSRIRYYRNSHNIGATPNINRVAELSSGEYFKWAFYDDLIAPEFLEKCIRILDQDPTIALCIPKSNIIDENSKFLGIHKYHSDVSAREPHIRFRNYVLNYDAGWELFGLIRTAALRKTALHGWYPGSDHVFLAELALHGRFHVLPDAFLFPRIHPEQTWLRIAKERDRLSFENPSLENKIVLTKWGWVFGYLTAIRHAPLNTYQRMHCWITLARWMIRPDHFRALGMDILLALKKYVSYKFYESQSYKVK